MSTIQVVHNLVSEKFLEMGLELHKEPKTAIRDLNHESIDFVGFKLDPTGIRIRARNVSRFKNRIIKKINEEFEIEDISEQKEIIRKVIEEKIAPQIIGTKALKVDICWNCMKPIKPRNWMTFFSAVTDINQFKSLDSWLRKQLNAKLYKNFGIRARASDLKNAGLPSLTNEYYWSSKKHPGFCECDAVKTAGYFSSPIALKELMNTSDD